MQAVHARHARCERHLHDARADHDQRAIRDSRLCVVVLSAHQALSTMDMALIRLISQRQSREVIIFVNRIDELSDPASQVPEIHRSILETLRSTTGRPRTRSSSAARSGRIAVSEGKIDEMTDDRPRSARYQLDPSRLAEQAMRPGRRPAGVWACRACRRFGRALGQRMYEGPVPRGAQTVIAARRCQPAAGIAGRGRSGPASGATDGSAEPDDDAAAGRTPQRCDPDRAASRAIEKLTHLTDHVGKDFTNRDRPEL